MQKKLFLRVLTIGFLTLLLLIPLAMIRGVVAERQGLQLQVENTIAQKLAGPQRLAGPLLMVDYVIREETIVTDARGHETKQFVERQRHAVFTPENLAIDATTTVDTRHKGLYRALVYETNASLAATFKIPAHLGLEADKHAFRIGKAWLVFGLADVRGLRATPTFLWGKQPLVIANGSRSEALGDGMHGEIGVLDFREAHDYDATLKLNFAGTRALAVAPLGKTTVMNMKASWPHPNFGGRFLPQTHKSDATGFTARWEISHLASKNSALAMQGATGGDAEFQKKRELTPLETFDVSFVEPVNIYLQAERAVKYGILFIVLIFAAFFLFEILKDLRIHPLQYALVGAALALFFLLLVSLSEHLPFLRAYLIAATACVVLIGYYLAHVLGGWRRGAAFALKLALLYAVLYSLLLSEDNALMLGSLLLFAGLATFMILTRRIDWYRLGGENAAPNTGA